jgi:hypothetical protein
MLHLLQNQIPQSIPTEEALLTSLEALTQNPYNEIWLTGHGTTSLTILTNGQSAFLMFLRHEGDSGFSSRNPTSPSSDTTISFKLANGQVDQYPADWVVPLTSAWQAAIDYFKTGKMSKEIIWEED